MYMNRLFIFISVLFSLASCQSGESKKQEGNSAETPVFADDTVTAAASQPQGKSATEMPASDTAHTAQNSLDWAGTYKGTLPCADCEGIQTELTLGTYNTFKISQTYLGKKNTFSTQGSFDWIDATRIKLKGSGVSDLQYMVAEGKVYQLDKNGRVIKGNLSRMYILKKTQ